MCFAQEESARAAAVAQAAAAEQAFARQQAAEAIKMKTIEDARLRAEVSGCRCDMAVVVFFLWNRKMKPGVRGWLVSCERKEMR